jgi:hypothetical protein
VWGGGAGEGPPPDLGARLIGPQIARRLLGSVNTLRTLWVPTTVSWALISAFMATSL